MCKLIIIRGIPGSGKTTRAKELEAQYIAEGKTVGRYEADDYWMVNGEYKFNKKYLHRAHRWCHAAVVRSMAIVQNDVTIVSNTFTTNKEMQGYRETAIELDIRTEFIECPGKWESLHNVPAEALERMRNRWEAIREL